MEPKDLTITKLRLDPTSLCNEKCTFCPFHGIDKRIKLGSHIEISHYVKIAKELDLHHLHPTVRLVGSGEPTLYPNFVDLLRVFREHGHNLRMITNGQMLTKFALPIREYISTLVVSVHGTENTHDTQVNKRGSYSTILKGIKSLNSLPDSPELLLHFVITPQNYKEMIVHAQIADSLKAIPRYQHLVFTPGNKLLGNFDLNELKDIISHLRLNFPKVQFIPDLTNEQIDPYYDSSQIFIRTPNKCRRIWDDLSVRYDGKIIMCDNRYLGDITKASIIDIINGKKRLEYLVQRTLLASSEKGLPNTCSRCCYN